MKEYGDDLEDEITEECWSCGGIGYFELYDEDPLWYCQDDTEKCEVCDGKGFYVIYPDEIKNQCGNA